MELLKDYDLQIRYHPGKANLVADALTKKTQHCLNAMVNTQPEILRDLEARAIELVSPRCMDGLLMALEVQPSLIEEIKTSQKDDAKLERVRRNMAQGKLTGFVVHKDWTLKFENRLCVPDKEEIKERF